MSVLFALPAALIVLVLVFRGVGFAWRCFFHLPWQVLLGVAALLTLIAAMIRR